MQQVKRAKMYQDHFMGQILCSAIIAMDRQMNMNIERSMNIWSWKIIKANT